ncbi:hypothetical protein AXK57_21910 [Tsukamurella pulmonis]|nr:hypothetical protein AXK57_21910 [Tsukamurella pulmonis]
MKASAPRGRAAATPTTFGGKFQRAAEAALQNRLFVICFAIIVLVGIALIIGLLLDDSSAAASVLLDRAANLRLRPVPLG